MLFTLPFPAERNNNWLHSQACATTCATEIGRNWGITNQVPDINLSEAIGIWELSGLVPTCDAEALSVHTPWFSEKNYKRGKEVEREDSYEQIFLFFAWALLSSISSRFVSPRSWEEDNRTPKTAGNRA